MKYEIRFCFRAQNGSHSEIAVFLIHQQTYKMDWTFLQNIELKQFGFFLD